MIDAILYVVRTGCQWRNLPHDFPKWKTVYNNFLKWRNDGTWIGRVESGEIFTLHSSGLILSVVIHAASIQDQDGAKLVLQNIKEMYKRLKVIFGDSTYKRSGLPDGVKEELGCFLQPVLRPVDVEGFVVLPKRWIIERTFVWLKRFRRHSKDYERNPNSSVAVIYIAMTKNMLNMLENNTLRV